MRDKYSGGAFVNMAAIADYLRQEEGLLKKMGGLVEAYPDLKANEQLAYVMKALVEMENEIAFMREGYNGAVMAYNKVVQAFPDNILAKAFGMPNELDYLQGEKVIREAIRLDMD